MKVCVVGNGPRAEGRGDEIDACDFVVRMKSWWSRGAVNAGERIDAWGWFGLAESLDGPPPPAGCEYWFTHCAEQDRAIADKGKERRRLFESLAGDSTRRYLSDALWRRLRNYLRCHPSTGIVVVAMAIKELRPSHLVLVGFDSTTPDREDYWDARPPRGKGKIAHNVVGEKHAFAELFNGRWLGGPLQLTLTWLGMPEGVACKT